MRKFSLVTLLILAIFNQSIALAEVPEVKSCEYLFNPKWVRGTTPVTTTHKLYYIEDAIRSKSQNAFDGMDLVLKEGKHRTKLEKHLSKIDFERLTPNHVLSIHEHIAALPFPVRKQLYLIMTKRGHLAEEDFNTARIADDLMQSGLAEFIKENGGIHDRDIRDHYRVYLKKYYPMLSLIFASVYSVFTVFELPALISNFQGLFNPEISAVHFRALPEKVQEDILINGLANTSIETTRTLRLKSFLSLDYEITSKVIQTLGTLIALAFLLDQLSHHYLGYTIGNVFDDIVHREDLEEATYQVLSTGLVPGKDFDESLVRKQIHKMSLNKIETQLSEH